MAPLILLAERSSGVWLISNQGIWTRLLPWLSFPFPNPWRLLDKHVFTSRHRHLLPGTVPKEVVQTLAPGLVVLGGIVFKGFVCLTRVQLTETSAGFHHGVWACGSAARVSALLPSTSVCLEHLLCGRHRAL